LKNHYEKGQKVMFFHQCRQMCAITTRWCIPRSIYSLLLIFIVSISAFASVSSISVSADVVVRDPVPPEIVSVSTSVFTDTDGTYEIGGNVRISVTDGSGNPTFTGTVSIVSLADPWQVTDELISQGGGLYYYMWDTNGRIPGDYYIETTLEDEFGNVDDDGLTVYPDVTVHLQDITPPQVVQVRSMVDMDGVQDFNGTYPEDSEVLIRVYDVNNELGLTGTITIVDDDDATIVNREALTSEPDGTYTYLWYTDELSPGKYDVETTLLDPYGNKDADGLSNHPDLVITLEDVTPPDVYRVDSSVGLDEDGKYYIGSHVYIEAIEDNSEEGLTGQIYIYSRKEDDYALWDYLYDEGDGKYSYIWDTLDFEPGKYEIEVTLEDSHGNEDNDGADEDVDLLITLQYESTPPSVLKVWPLFNAVDVSREVVIFVEFTEPLDVENLYPGFYILADESGETINGLLRYNTEGNQTRFTPLERLKGNHTYTITLTTNIHDIVGNPLKNPIVWSFTTQPTPTPAITYKTPLDDRFLLNMSDPITFSIDHIFVPGEKIDISWYVNDKLTDRTGETSFRFVPKDATPGTNWVKVVVTAGEASTNQTWEVIVVELQPETGGRGSSQDGDTFGNLIFWINFALIMVCALVVVSELIIARKKYKIPPSESDQSIGLEPHSAPPGTQLTVQSTYTGQMPEAIAVSPQSIGRGPQPSPRISPSPQTSPQKMLPPAKKTTRPVEKTRPPEEKPEHIACYNCGGPIPIPHGKRSGTVICPECGTKGAL